MKKLLPWMLVLVVPGCAHESVTGSRVETPPAPPGATAPTPLPALEPVVLVAPPPAQVEPQTPSPDCNPYEFHFLGWRLAVSARDIVATPTWGLRGGPSAPIPAACLDLWVGRGGPTWHGDLSGAPDPLNPYRYLVAQGAHGTKWVCTRTSGDCVDVTV